MHGPVRLEKLSDIVTLVCGRCYCDSDVSVCRCEDVKMCMCVWGHGACLQSLTPGVSPQACAGGEEESEESEEGGGGSTAAHLLEALRQFRLQHRGQYRTVLEDSLATYRLRGESAEEYSRTSDDDDDNDSQEQPASPPSPPSPPPSPATAESEGSQDPSAPESDPSSDWESHPHTTSSNTSPIPTPELLSVVLWPLSSFPRRHRTWMNTSAISCLAQSVLQLQLPLLFISPSVSSSSVSELNIQSSLWDSIFFHSVCPVLWPPCQPLLNLNFAD